MQQYNIVVILSGVRIRYYETGAGTRPVEKYVEELPLKEQAEVAAVLADLATNGVQGAAVTMRHIGGKLWEMKVSRHRIFYVVLIGPEMVLLHAYKKQGQKAPPKEIEVATNRMKEVLNG